MRRIRGVRYTRISDGTRNLGVIAHEMLAAGVPEMVREGEDGLLSIDYGSGFSPYLPDSVVPALLRNSRLAGLPVPRCWRRRSEGES